MKLDTILDASVPHIFWGDLQAAKRASCAEAANTASVILRVDAIEVQIDSVTFIGAMPDVALEPREISGRATRLIGTLHTTWGALLYPAGIIGYLVVTRLIAGRAQVIRSAEVNRAALSVKRTFRTMPPMNLGPICCHVCRLPIPDVRLKATPNSKLCVSCQTMREEKNDGGCYRISR